MEFCIFFFFLILYHSFSLVFIWNGVMGFFETGYSYWTAVYVYLRLQIQFIIELREDVDPCKAMCRSL